MVVKILVLRLFFSAKTSVDLPWEEVRATGDGATGYDDDDDDNNNDNDGDGATGDEVGRNGRRRQQRRW